MSERLCKERQATINASTLEDEFNVEASKTIVDVRVLSRQNIWAGRKVPGRRVQRKKGEGKKVKSRRGRRKTKQETSTKHTTTKYAFISAAC